MQYVSEYYIVFVYQIVNTQYFMFHTHFSIVFRSYKLYLGVILGHTLVGEFEFLTKSFIYASK